MTTKSSNYLAWIDKFVVPIYVEYMYVIFTQFYVHVSSPAHWHIRE